MTGVARLLLLKYVTKAAMIEAGVDPRIANRIVDAWGGWFWACHNIALFSGVAAPGSYLFGTACASIYWDLTRPDPNGP